MAYSYKDYTNDDFSFYYFLTKPKYGEQKYHLIVTHTYKYAIANSLIKGAGTHNILSIHANNRSAIIQICSLLHIRSQHNLKL